MKLSLVFCAALAAVAQAKVVITNVAADFGSIVAGKPFTLTWANNTGDVTITLETGPNTNLKDVKVLAQNQGGNSATFTFDSTLPSGIYAFKIEDQSSDGPNFSVQWNFQGGPATSTPNSSSSTTTGASSSTTGTSSTTANTSSTTTNTSSHSSTTSKSSSSTSSHASTTSSTPTTTPANTNDALRANSPLALVLVTVVALLYFN